MSHTNPPPIVDFGAHFYPELPEPVLAKHEAIEAYAGAPICTDVDGMLGRYAEAGIDRIVISQPFYMGSGDAEQTAEVNDDLLEVIEAHDRLYGLAAIPTTAGGDAAAEELERSLKAGYHGGALETMTEGIDLLDDSLTPVYEVADEAGAPILVHPNVSHQEDGSAGAGGAGDRWELDSIFGTEASLARSICKVVHEGLYDEYEDLTLVFHHNGGNIASMMSRINLWINRAKRTGSDHLKPYDEFARQVEERVYIDTAGYFGEPRPFRSTFEAFPASNVLYATDFPYETVMAETFEKIVGTILELRPEIEAEAVLGGNALEILANT